MQSHCHSCLLYIDETKQNDTSGNTGDNITHCECHMNAYNLVIFPLYD